LSPIAEVISSSVVSQASVVIHQQLITFYGQVLTLNLTEEESVESVKAKIESKEDIPSDQQLLFFAGQQLEDEKQLSYYRIGVDTTRHLVLRLRDGMKIFVKTLSDKTIEVQVDPGETIEIVKVKIHEQEGISPCDQRLLQDGRDLADLRTLSDYGIKHKSTLQLDLHLGGPCPICQTQFKNSSSSEGSPNMGGKSPRNQGSSGKGGGSSSSASTSSYSSASPRHSGKHD
jgi:ubiquitin